MKLLLIKNQEESSWGSCKVISPNLHQLYKSLDDLVIEWFEVPQDLVKAELAAKTSLAQRLKVKIESFKPDQLVFLDHLPVPATLLAHLSVQVNLRKLPPLVFHIYGDFTYFSSEWLFLNNELKGHKIEFIVASSAQKNLLYEFLEEKKGVSKLCFPVNDQEYFYKEEERIQTRKSFHLNENDFILLYSGRISLQKNVDILIKEFIELRKKSPRPLKLWVVGSFDDVGAEFLGYNTYPGYMFSKIQKLLASYSPKETEDIVFWGHQSKKELRMLKAASDAFVSLSLYHDEDYGMSPAEALATGLPSLLTDWGGYAGFADSKNWQCELIPVDIGEFGLELSSLKLREQAINLIINQSEHHTKREARSKAFMDQFSIRSNVALLQKILEANYSSFGGFNWHLEQYSSALGMNWAKNKLNKFLTPEHHSFYHQIYRNYISLNK